MSSFPRAEMDEMVELWLSTNKRCEEANDWKLLGDLYTEDATYGWNLGPQEDFMVAGRDEICRVALGMEMGGLDGWKYPYQRILVDEVAGEVVGFWRQVADATRSDGSVFEVGGIGGSWFGYAGNHRWAWQRDFFDFGNAVACFMEMIKADKLSPGMTARMQRSASGKRLPGHYRRGEAPVPLWP